jgi:hypothetical protein
MNKRYDILYKNQNFNQIDAFKIYEIERKICLNPTNEEDKTNEDPSFKMDNQIKNDKS